METVYRIWPKVGGIAAIVILLGLLVWFILDPLLNVFSWLFWLHLPVLMIHQFEEYVFPGGFKKFFGSKMLNIDSEFMSDRTIFIGNVGMWFVIAAAAIVGTKAIWFPVMLLIFNAGNSLAHSLPFAIKARGYNPGFLSSLFLMLPFTVYVVLSVINANLMTTVELIVAIAGGLILLVCLVSGGATIKLRMSKSD